MTDTHTGAKPPINVTLTQDEVTTLLAMVPKGSALHAKLARPLGEPFPSKIERWQGVLVEIKEHLFGEFDGEERQAASRLTAFLDAALADYHEADHDPD